MPLVCENPGAFLGKRFWPERYVCKQNRGKNKTVAMGGLKEFRRIQRCQAHYHIDILVKNTYQGSLLDTCRSFIDMLEILTVVELLVTQCPCTRSVPSYNAEVLRVLTTNNDCNRGSAQQMMPGK